MKLTDFWAEALFGLAILFFREYAIFLLFIYIVIRLTIIYEAFRKLIRVYQVANDVKLLAIMKKLKITEEEIQKETNENLEKLTPKQREMLEKDFQSIVVSSPK